MTEAMSSGNAETVRRAIDAYRRGDYEAASAYLAHDVVWEVGQEGPARGPAAVREAWGRWDREWDELETTPDEIIEVDDNVVVAMSYRGRGPASGAEVTERIFELHRFREGKCVSKTEFRDRAEAIAAAGAD